MKMFLSSTDHNQFLASQIAANPERVFISTFGMYLGITYDGRDSTEWGKDYQLATRDLAESMRSLSNVDILVGVANYRSCKGKINCLDCEKQYVRTLLRHVNHAEMFPEFNWKMTTDLHLKSFIFYFADSVVGVTGGRNFTDSDWTDVTFVVGPDEIEAMEGLADPIWADAYDITDTNVGKIFEEQEISKSGFESVLAGISGLNDKNQDRPF